MILSRPWPLHHDQADLVRQHLPFSNQKKRQYFFLKFFCQKRPPVTCFFAWFLNLLGKWRMEMFLDRITVGDSNRV